MVEQIENIGRLLGPITSSSLDWAGLLVNVNHSIPGDVWLTDVTAGFTSNAKGDNASAPGTGGRNQLILRGCSYNYHSLAGWLKDIRHVPELSMFVVNSPVKKHRKDSRSLVLRSRPTYHLPGRGTEKG